MQTSLFFFIIYIRCHIKQKAGILPTTVQFPNKEADWELLRCLCLHVARLLACSQLGHVFPQVTGDTKQDHQRPFYETLPPHLPASFPESPTLLCPLWLRLCDDALFLLVFWWHQGPRCSSTGGGGGGSESCPKRRRQDNGTMV